MPHPAANNPIFGPRTFGVFDRCVAGGLVNAAVVGALFVYGLVHRRPPRPHG